MARGLGIVEGVGEGMKGGGVGEERKEGEGGEEMEEGEVGLDRVPLGCVALSLGDFAVASVGGS